LPYDVPANEYLMVGGRQLSKSRNWMIDALDYLDRYDPDPLRYALTINGPERSDTNFTWDEYVRRNNDELVATWGNLVNRVLTFTYRKYDKQVPQPGELDERDTALLDMIRAGFEPIGQLIEECKFKAALTEIMALAHEANRYLNEKEPWARIKDDPEAAGTTLFVCLQTITWLRTLLTPFLPFTCQQLHEMLGFDGSLIGRIYREEVQESTRSHLVLRFDDSELVGSWAPETLAPGQILRKPNPLFRKLEPGVAEEEMARMLASAGE